MSTETLHKTPLHALHLELGARMVPFAGYDMPVQYPLGVMKEHLHTREQAGLFDVSHMGQIRLTGANAAKALDVVQAYPWLWLAPGIAISLFVLSVNIIGDGLRDALDPNQ